MKDGVFVLRGPDGREEWKACLNGEVLPTEWNSKGAAEAGLEVEWRRSQRRSQEATKVILEELGIDLNNLSYEDKCWLADCDMPPARKYP